jgi:hypothetical protein
MPPILKVQMSNGMDRGTEQIKEEEQQQTPFFGWFWFQWIGLFSCYFAHIIHRSHTFLGCLSHFLRRGRPVI